MLEAKAPKKTMRKVRCDSAARAVPDRAGSGVSPSTTASSISSMEMEPSSPHLEVRSGRRTRAAPAHRTGGPKPVFMGQGPAAEQMDPQGTSNADAGATGTVSSDAAPALRCTW